MTRMTTMQKTGLATLILSIVSGAAGSAWSIYSSFDALKSAENAGIGQVGDEIRNALLFTVIGIAASVVGLLLLVLGRSKNERG